MFFFKKKVSEILETKVRRKNNLVSRYLLGFIGLITIHINNAIQIPRSCTYVKTSNLPIWNEL